MIRSMRVDTWTMCAIALLPIAARIAAGQDVGQVIDVRQSTTDENTAQPNLQSNIERYEKVLRSNPQAGIAFDKFYESLKQSSKLDAFCDQLETQAHENDDSKLLQLLGLVQLQRGETDKATASFSRATELAPSDVSARLQLSLALIQGREFVSATTTLRAAVETNPSQTFALQIVMQLRQLARRINHEAASELLVALADQFPSSQPVIEKVAQTLVEIDATKALPMYEKLIQLTRDTQRRIELQIDRAKLMKRLGQSEQSLLELEKLVARVKPESWLHTNLLEQIEQLAEDLDGTEGLIERYERMILERPDNTKVHTRLAKVLHRTERFEEAESVLAAAHRSAPTQTAPLLTLVDLLERREKYNEAASVMNQLLELMPENADFIEQRGRLLMLDTSKGIDERRAQVIAVWSRLLVGHEQDAARIVQIAELFSEFDMPSQAIAFYRKAISVAEDRPELREILGIYLHHVGRLDEARAEIKDAIDAAANDRVSLISLSDVAARLSFRDEAVRALQIVCSKQPQFSDRMKLAKLLRSNAQASLALDQLNQAADLAENASEWNALWDAELEVLRALPYVERQTRNAEVRLHSEGRLPVEDWLQLALLHAAGDQHTEAASAAKRATDVEPSSLRAWLLAAKTARDAGLTFQEIESLQALCQIDDHNKGDYLQRLATIQFQQKQTTESLETIDKIIASRNASLQSYQMAWTYCLQVSMTERAIGYMRRAARAFPSDRGVWLALARQLDLMSNRSESQAAAWRALKFSEEKSEQRAVFDLLLKLYTDASAQLDMVERFEDFGFENDRVDDADKWIAWALQASDQSEMPRWFFKRLEDRSNVTPQLLEASVHLALKHQAYRTALGFQKRLARQVPNPVNRLRVGEFLAMDGDWIEARVAWRDVLREQEAKAGCVAFAKDLVARKQMRLVAELIDEALQQKIDYWELLAFGIVAALDLEKMDQATSLAERLLGLNLPHDLQAITDVSTVSESVAQVPKTVHDRLAWLEHAGDWQTKLNEVNLVRASYRSLQSNPRASRVSAIRQLAVQRGAALRTNPASLVAMQCFGDARALAILVRYGKANLKRTGDRESWLDYLRGAIDSKDIQRLWDCVLILDPQRSRALAVNSNGQIEQRSEVGLDRYPEVLDTLIALDQHEAAELAVNEVVTRRHMQYQMASRLYQSTPKMTESELTRLQRLIETCDKLGIQIALNGKLTLALELMCSEPLSNAAEIQNPVALLEKTLSKTDDIAELASCASLFQSLGHEAEQVTSRVLLRAFTLQLASPVKSNELQVALHSFVDAQGKSRSNFAEFLSSMVDIQAEFVAGLSTDALSVDSRMNVARTSYRNSVEVRPNQVFPDDSSLCSPSLAQALASALSAMDEMELVRLLAGKSDASSSSSHERAERAVCWFSLSVVQSMRGQYDAALESLLNAHEQSFASEIVALQRVRLLVAMNQLSDAAEVLAEVNTLNRSILRECELWKLELALRRDDEVASQRAASVLSNLPLSPQENVAVGAVLNRK